MKFFKTIIAIGFFVNYTNGGCISTCDKILEVTSYNNKIVLGLDKKLNYIYDKLENIKSNFEILSNKDKILNNNNTKFNNNNTKIHNPEDDEWVLVDKNIEKFYDETLKENKLTNYEFISELSYIVVMIFISIFVCLLFCKKNKYNILI